LLHRERPEARAAARETIHAENEEERMQPVHEGQCGLCTHFGEHHGGDSRLTQIRSRHEAPETLVDECGHPRHASLHLRVTPISGCDGFEPAR
jgi:hypothetical protein